MRRLASIAAIIPALVAACGGSPTHVVGGGVLGKNIRPLSTTNLPQTMLGLGVRSEDVSKALTAGSRSYVSATSVYSFRRADNLLQATLQISQFQTSARYQSDKFRQTLVAGVGGTVPLLVHVGGQQVWLTTGDLQRIAVWFHGAFLFILAERQDFPLSRALLRQALQITP